MLRKISTADPVLKIIGTYCVEQNEISPIDPPPEARETDIPETIPVPPVVVTDDDEQFFDATVQPPPRCPLMVRKTYFNPLTGQTEFYYEVEGAKSLNGVSIPQGCMLGAGIFS